MFVTFCFDEAKYVYRKECSITQHTHIYLCIVVGIMEKETLPPDSRGIFTHHDDADSRFLQNVRTYKQAKLCHTLRDSHIKIDRINNLKYHQHSYLDFYKTAA
jgi:hypothetical protein